MTTQITLTLPDEMYHQLEQIAQSIGRDVADVIVTNLETSAPTMIGSAQIERLMKALSDAEVLALSESMMDAAQDQRLSELLDHQQAGTLRDEERSELRALMQLYEEGLLRKAYALAEAVKRGLRPPLAP